MGAPGVFSAQFHKALTLVMTMAEVAGAATIHDNGFDGD
jgi:hypothetical protein